MSSGRLTVARAGNAGVAGIRELSAALRRDYDIATTEDLEAALKEALRGVLAEPPTLSTALAVARAQRDLGYVVKFKSYGIKCAHPLGYSVFLQRPGGGFSFQRHRVHKVEVFHVLATSPGARAFICDFADWERVYEPERFAAWLAGSPCPDYEQFAHRPVPGDVLAVDRLNVVHSVLGCTVEEFATVSTDMVDRLHDQNRGAPIPPDFSRGYAERELNPLPYPATSRRVDAGSCAAIDEAPVPGGTVRVYVDSFLRAAHYTLHAAGPWHCDAARAAALTIKAGSGRLRLAVGDAPPADLALRRGDVTTVLPGVRYRVVPDRAGVSYSEQRIAPATAFTTLAR